MFDNFILEEDSLGSGSIILRFSNYLHRGWFDTMLHWQDNSLVINLR